MTSTIDPQGGLIRADGRGRMLVKPAQREALLDAFERSGQSGMAFCRQHGLKYPTFANWLQKRRRGEGASAGPAFAEVVLDGGRSESGGAAPALPLRITLPSGAVMEVASQEQAALAVHLIRSLASSRSC